MLRIRFGISLPVVAACSVGAVKNEVDVGNDSLDDGNSGTRCECLVPGEHAAVGLDSPCDGDIVAVQVFLGTAFGGDPKVTEQGIHIYDGSSFPDHGDVHLQNAGGVDATIPGPSLVDGQLNEIRFLDSTADTVPLSVPVSAGQTFVVSLEFLNDVTNNPFASTVVWDMDGCQTGRNGNFVIPGGWQDSCLIGVTGDWMIRAVVDCPLQ